jgi:hypothetical protein
MSQRQSYCALKVLIIGGFAPCFVNYNKGCTRLAAASDKVYRLLAHGRWFSPGTPASSTTKTGRHDIAEILLKVALVECTLCCNLQSRARTHAEQVIGLYELLGNSTTQPIEPPGPSKSVWCGLTCNFRV